MILDTLENYTAYLGLSPELDDALKALAQQTKQPFSANKKPLIGGGWYFGTQYHTKDKSTLKCEAHQKYIDVMAAVEGEEVIYWKPVSELQHITAPYDSTIEALLADVDEDAATLLLHPGRFVIFFPEDAHAPGGMSEDRSNTITKYIAKVPV